MAVDGVTVRVVTKAEDTSVFPPQRRPARSFFVSRREDAIAVILTMLRTPGAKKVWSYKEIQRLLKSHGINGASTGPSIMCRLACVGCAERVSKSHYQLTERGRTDGIDAIKKIIRAKINA